MITRKADNHAALHLDLDELDQELPLLDSVRSELVIVHCDADKKVVDLFAGYTNSMGGAS